MFSYVWPIALVVFSNTLYHICAKEIPGGINPFASLTVTYLVAAAASGLLFLFTGSKEGSLIQQYSNLNWAPFGLGLVIIGLEVGTICVYKAGWSVSTASVVQNAFLSLTLVVVGLVLYHEVITWTKVAGILICLVGLLFINH